MHGPLQHGGVQPGCKEVLFLPLGRKGVYGGSRVQWQCPVLGPGCQRVSHYPWASRALGIASALRGLVEQMGEETGMCHRAWKPRVWGQVTSKYRPKPSRTEECVC